MPRRQPKSDVQTSLARFNAVRHGLTADAPVIPGESLEEWQSFRTNIMDALALEGAFEIALGERIATLFWESRRVSRYERKSIAVALDRVEADYAENQRKASWNEDFPKSVAEATERLDAAHRQFDILAHLNKRPPTTPIATIDANAILEAFADEADMLVEEYLAEIPDPDPEGAWTNGRLIAVLKAIAARDEQQFTASLAAVLGNARKIAHGAELMLTKVQVDIDIMRRQGNIPSGPTIETLLRYGAAKNRMLFQAINQLEATQARRLGQPTPLLRTQVYGLPDDPATRSPLRRENIKTAKQVHTQIQIARHNSSAVPK